MESISRRPGGRQWPGGPKGSAMSLPAGIDLKTRAELMNAFWRALVRLQYQDVIVVAVCATGGSRNLAPAARHALDGTF